MGSSSSAPTAKAVAKVVGLQAKVNHYIKPPIADGSTIEFQPLHADNHCLDVSGGEDRNGAKLHLWQCNGSPAQRWTAYLVDGVKGTYRFSPKCSPTRVMHFSSEGAQLELAACGDMHSTTDANDLFTLYLVADGVYSIHANDIKFMLTFSESTSNGDKLTVAHTSSQDEKPFQKFRLFEVTRNWKMESFDDIITPLLHYEPNCRALLLEPNDARQAVDRISQLCLERDVVFADSLFPHNRDTVAGTRYRTGPPELVPACQEDGWERPRGLVKQPTLYSDGAGCGDIRQGFLGNCWFCGMVDSLATRPDLTKTLFYPATYNPAGIYAARAYINQKEYYVLIDDFFPVQKGSLIFARESSAGEYWFPLYEKTFAKIFGGFYYLNANTGCGTDGLVQRLPDVWQALCRATQEVIPTTNADAVARIQQCLAAGGLVNASTPSAPATPLPDLGIVMGHVYSVLRVATLGSLTLIQLRNTWGSYEWKGPWSDSDTASWDNNKEMKALCGYTGASDEGIFWIAPADLCKYYCSIMLAPVATDTLPYQKTLDVVWPANKTSEKLNTLFLSQLRLVRTADGPLKITVVQLPPKGTRAPAPVRVHVFDYSNDSAPLAAPLNSAIAASNWDAFAATLSIPLGKPKALTLVPCSSSDDSGAFRVCVLSATDFTLTQVASGATVGTAVAPWIPTTTDVVPYQVTIGGSSTATKVLSVPGVVSCNPQPLNKQESWWQDKFSAVADPATGKLTVTRIDTNGGWGQPLRMLASRKPNFKVNVKQSACDIAVEIAFCAFAADGEYFEIVPSYAKEFRLDVAMGADKEGNNIIAYENNGGASQLWKFVKTSGGKWQLQPKNAPTRQLTCFNVEGKKCETNATAMDGQQLDVVEKSSTEKHLFTIGRSDCGSKVAVDCGGRGWSNAVATCAPPPAGQSQRNYSLVRGTGASASTFDVALINDKGETVSFLVGQRSPAMLFAKGVAPGTYGLCVAGTIGQGWIAATIAAGGQVEIN